MCDNKVIAMWRKDGTPVEVKCGRTWAGDTLLCETCEDEMHKRYPQGWKYYPGDTCKHGVYVGGCGEDYMCPECENGG